MNSVPGPAPASDLVQGLVQDRPFGDSAYIHGQAGAAFLRRLDKISLALPAAGDLAAALAAADAVTSSAVLADPVVRGVTQQALSQLSRSIFEGMPLAQCAEVFEAAARHVAEARPGGPLESEGVTGGRLGGDAAAPWLWSDDRADGVCTRAFRYLVEQNFGAPLCSPRPENLATLQQAAAILDQVAPSLARSALSHARLIALFPQAGRWEKVTSCSQFRIVGVIFLGRDMLRDPVSVAEHVLHEALHQKLYDLRHAHSVLARDFEPEREEVSGAAPAVVSLWNLVSTPGSARWGPSRTLAAFHVYAHLAVYGRLLEAAPDQARHLAGAAAGLTSATSAFRRAYYLGTQLREKYGDELGLAGQCLVDWLMQCLELVSPGPSDPGLRAALLLERYAREIPGLESLSGPARHQVNLPAVLAREVDVTREALQGAGLSGLQAGLDDRLPDYRTGDGIDPAVRRLLQPALARVTEATITDADSPVPELVAAMVESSSGILTRALEVMSPADPSLPWPGGQAAQPFDDRAELLRLTDVIGPAFGTEKRGLWLYSIVRMHEPATIVELGTGLGTSAFWMALAAKHNDRGHVWTVDDLSLTEGYPRILAQHRARLAGTAWAGLPKPTALDCLTEIRRVLGLAGRLSFITRRIDLTDIRHFDGYEFGRPIDLLFSDFSHGPEAILALLGQFLPKMAPASSVFIDGASTSWPSYLLLERLVGQLNDGTVPAILAGRSPGDLSAALRGRRIVLVHLTEPGKQLQNSMAWLKIEPVDLQPHPATLVRGMPA